MEKGKKILVIGDSMLDIYHFGRVDRISPEAPVPVFLETGKEKYVPGGAANVAVNIAAIGVCVGLCSCVGMDDMAGKLLELLEEQKVDAGTVYQSGERRTTTKLRYIGPNMQQIVRVDTEDTQDINYGELLPVIKEIRGEIGQYGLFLISDYKKGFLTERVTQAFIELANEAGIPCLVDVKDTNYRKYRNATLLKPNRKELGQLTGLDVSDREKAVRAAEYLRESASSRYVLTTLGPDGMLLVGENGVLKEVKSAAKEVYDVTGAGDTSIAYLAAEMLLGKEIGEAVEIANYAAGVQVSKVGTSIVYPEEVAAAMQAAGDRQGCKQLDFYREGGLAGLAERQKKGSRIVFTNGCFDILHAGHITYLKEAKKLGDILVVGVNSDDSVKRLKGSDRPINSLEDRMLLLSALECVDFVVAFEEDTPLALIRKIMPDVLVKGGDYRADNIVGAQEVMQNGGEVKILPFVDGKSTTGIVNKMRGNTQG